MKTTFLEYYKIILDKVRFDHALFMKEYAKAMKHLEDNEMAALNSWLSSTSNLIDERKQESTFRSSGNRVRQST